MRSIYSLALGVFLLGSVSAQAASPRGDNFFGGIYAGSPFITHDEMSGFTANGNDFDSESKAGYGVGGFLGGWINGAQRMEISIGYRAYETNIKVKPAGKDATTGNVLRAPATPNPACATLAVGVACQPSLAFIAPAIVAATARLADTTKAAALTAATALAASITLVPEAMRTDPQIAMLATAEAEVVRINAENTADTAALTVLEGLEENGVDADVDINVIPIMFNNYFYPLYFWRDSVPAAAQNFYLGVGVGVGLWDYSAADTLEFEDSFKTFSVMVQASLGYDFYLADLGLLPSAMDGVAIGVNYQFTWSNAKPNVSFVGTGGSAANISFNSETLDQKSHALLVTARYDF